MSPEFAPLTLRLAEFFDAWAVSLPMPDLFKLPDEIHCSGIEFAVWLAVVGPTDFPEGILRLNLKNFWPNKNSGVLVLTTFDENTDLTDEPVITPIRWRQRDPLTIPQALGLTPKYKSHLQLQRLPQVVAFLRMIGQG